MVKKRKSKGITIKKDGGALVHKDLNVGSDTSIKVPQVDTGYGAGFGDVIADSDRVFAVTREPVASFVVFGVAADITDKWFIINDPDTEEADPELDRGIQDQLSKLKFPTRLTDLIESERTYGESLLVGGFNDAKTVEELKNPLSKGSELMQFSVYPQTVKGEKIKEILVSEKDEEPNSARFGEPTVYQLHRGGGAYLFVHYTRCYMLHTRSSRSSVLDPIWDDLATGRNIRWGAGQWLYRTGSGFPVIKFPQGTTADELEAYDSSGAWSNLHSRTSLMATQNSPTVNDGIDIQFIGAAGHALDPTPFFKTNLEQISIATGIPMSKLVGAQAGTLSGSDVNNQDYYKVISREQLKLDDCIRWVIGLLAESGQLSMIKVASDGVEPIVDFKRKSVENYVVDWNSAFELSELDLAQVENLKEDANVKKLDYRTIDEVRGQCDAKLKPLPDGAGKELKTASMGLFGEEQGEEGNKEIKEADKFLVVDLSKGNKKHEHVTVGKGSTSG